MPDSKRNKQKTNQAKKKTTNHPNKPTNQHNQPHPSNCAIIYMKVAKFNLCLSQKTLLITIKSNKKHTPPLMD